MLIHMELEPNLSTHYPSEHLTKKMQSPLIFFLTTAQMGSILHIESGHKTKGLILMIQGST